MAVFKYEKLDRLGNVKKGTVSAVSYDHAAKKIVAMGGELVKLDEDKGGFWDKIARVKKRDIIVFTHGLVTLQKAGVPLLLSLNSLVDLTANKKMKRIEQDIIMAVDSGDSFSNALSRFPEMFGGMYIAMVKVAEATGKLDEILEKLHTTMEKEEDLKSQFKSALAYPCVVSIATLGIIFFILTFIVPKFVEVFQGMGVKMPFLTQVLIDFSGFIKTKGILIVPVLAVISLVFKKIAKIGRVKFFFDSFKLKIPVAGKLFREMILSHFAHSLYILLESGISIIESLGLVGNTLGNEVLARDVKQMSEYVSNGNSITEFIKLKRMFPSLVIQMISVGEESGALSNMLKEISDFYDNEIQRSLKTLLSMLEPLMIVVVGLMIGGILITLMMPLFGMLSGFSVQ